jgi:two-component system sensor histidine kinase VicK
MKIHFFSRTESNHRYAFQVYYTLQNLKTVQKISLIYFLLCLLIRVIFSFPGLPIHTINHINEFDNANWVSLFVNPIFYISSSILIRRFNAENRHLKYLQAIVVLFSLFIIISAMRASFYSMYNPRNTLLMYLMGIVVVGVFYTFEFYETILLTVITGLSFSLALPYYQHAFNELLLNNLASLVLLTVFFCFSRYLFSYRADNFMKLKAIEQKNAVIEYASQMKTEILGIVAHDLRNPLTAIKFASTLMEIDAPLNTEYHEYLQMIKTSCDKANTIINDLLEMAQNDQPIDLELEKTEMDEFMLLIIDDWLKDKKEQINILYNSTSPPLYAFINKEKMQRAMDNLISNAIKFSGELGDIEISLRNEDQFIYIDIKDFGVGIPKNLLPYIFDRFSKASRKGMRGEASVGLGLSIVKQIVQKHKGEIEVNSIEQQGTIFTIKVPAA